jgi:type II secretory pathway pseudopilin PulG
MRRLITDNQPDRNNRGDTIIEVLIAIAIAAFAIGISYATANRSLDQAISAREHNEALNVLENQLTDLRYRLKHQAASAAPFESTFGNSNPNHHYCLNDDSTGPDDTTYPWGPIVNGSITVNSALGPPTYNAKCNIQRTSGGLAEAAVYWVDIATSPSGLSESPTLYHITVRWNKLGGGTSQASLFYKLNGGTATTLGAATQSGGSILPSGTTTLTTNLAVMQWKGYNDPPNLVGYANGISFLNCTFKPLGVGDNCPRYRGTYNCQNTVLGTNFADPSPNAGKWDPNETCSLYSVTWQIPVDESLLKTVDFAFTNDHWDFSQPGGGRDNNIIVWDTDIPSPPVLYFGNYCQVNPSPTIPQSGTRLTDTNVLPLFWGGVTAHMYVDSNPPDGAQCT